MKPKTVKSLLQKQIDSLDLNDCAKEPGRNFSRSRKLPFPSLINTILRMEGQSLGNELISLFPAAADTPSASAFIQQRSKLKPGAFDVLFHSFVKAIDKACMHRTLNGLRVLAVDGSRIHVHTDPSHLPSFVPQSHRESPHNMLHLNAMYDLLQRTYIDEIIQDYHEANEQKAFVEMVDRSWLDNVLVMADRGYESYNILAHVAEKGWYFLIRAKALGSNGIASALDLPSKESFDLAIDLNITRRQTSKTKALFADRNHYRYISHTQTFDYLPVKAQASDPVMWYPLSFRVVVFPISEDSHEVILTNLPVDLYPSDEIKRLYAMRWGIETSFRDLKYTVGLLYFHSRKVEYIRHEIVARLIMYNVFELITAHVVIHKKERKHKYKVNFSSAAHVCRLFLRGDISPPDLEAHLSRSIIPIRPDRKRKREKHTSSLISFTYRLP